jgi:hypothetical protein
LLIADRWRLVRADWLQAATARRSWRECVEREADTDLDTDSDTDSDSG